MSDTPVCEDASPYSECEGEVIFTPDPYNEEMNGDTTPVWLCQFHYSESGLNI